MGESNGRLIERRAKFLHEGDQHCQSDGRHEITDCRARVPGHSILNCRKSLTRPAAGVAGVAAFGRPETIQLWQS